MLATPKIESKGSSVPEHQWQVVACFEVHTIKHGKHAAI
jgi:hypothetical protein